MKNAKRMKRLGIAAAKRVAEEHGAIQAIVLLFDGESYSAVSYGHTKASCSDVARTLDAIVDQLVDGEIPSPRPAGPCPFPRIDQAGEP